MLIEFVLYASNSTSVSSDLFVNTQTLIARRRLKISDAQTCSTPQTLRPTCNVTDDAECGGTSNQNGNAKEETAISDCCRASPSACNTNRWRRVSFEGALEGVCKIAPAQFADKPENARMHRCSSRRSIARHTNSAACVREDLIFCSMRRRPY